MKKIIYTTLLLIAPLSINAQVLKGAGGRPPTTKELFIFIAEILANAVVPLLITVALVVFITGVIQYMTGAAEQTQREKGRKFIIWGLIGLFVILAIWGILKIITGTFDIKFALPQLKE